MERTEKTLSQRALDRMVNDRAKWLKWVPASNIHVKKRYQNEPPFRSHEVLGTDTNEILRRFEFLSKKKGRHIGAWDRDGKRFVVLRTSHMRHSYLRGEPLWELERVRNKSVAYCRYRGLNSRWRQDTTPLKDYSIPVTEGEELGVELVHVDNEERTSQAYVGMLVVDKSNYYGVRVWRITGFTNDGSQLEVQETFSLGEVPEKGETKHPKSVRVLTMGHIMNWVLRLKAIMNECNA